MIYKFTLTSGSTVTDIIEPMGWVDFSSALVRDFKSHGVLYKFTDGTLNLGFAGAGRTILETAFQTYGVDAVVTFIAYERANENLSWVSVFTGNAVFENREYSKDFFEVDFEGSGFQQLVTNRMKTAVKLDAVTTIDGAAVADAITSQEQNWNGIRLKEEYEANRKNNNDPAVYSTFIAGSQYSTIATTLYNTLVLDFSGLINGELQEYKHVTDGYTNGNISSGNHNFEMSKAGDVTVSGSFKYRAVSVTNTNSLPTPVSQVYLKFKLRRATNTGVLISEVDIYTFSNAHTTQPATDDTGVLTIAFSQIIAVNLGDRLYVYIEHSCTFPYAGNGSFDSTIYFYNNSTYKFSLLKPLSYNAVRSFLVYDVLKRIVRLISGQVDGLKSDFFGNTENGYSVDGCGARYMVTNGFMLRSIQTYPSATLADMLMDLRSVFGIGWGFEKQYDGTYKLRIELMEYFYSDTQILSFSASSIKKDSYKESIYDNLVFNQINIGFKTYSKDEDYNGNLDDFSTEATYELPIKSVSGTYSHKCKMIASARLIQATFESRVDLTKTWKYDANLFLVAAKRTGSVFTPENNENFSTVTGVDDITSVYNLRIAPVYMFLNHALIVNSALFGKSLSSAITNSETKINQVFTAQLASAALCKLADSQRLVRSSVGNITIGNNFEGYRLFNPIAHEFTCAISSTEMQTLVDSIEANRGYISYLNNEGVSKQGYILSIKWNIVDRIAKFKTLERAINYGL